MIKLFNTVCMFLIMECYVLISTIKIIIYSQSAHHSSWPPPL